MIVADVDVNQSLSLLIDFQESSGYKCDNYNLMSLTYTESISIAKDGFTKNGQVSVVSLAIVC